MKYLSLLGALFGITLSADKAIVQKNVDSPNERNVAETSNQLRDSLVAKIDAKNFRSQTVRYPELSEHDHSG